MAQKTIYKHDYVELDDMRALEWFQHHEWEPPFDLIEKLTEPPAAHTIVSAAGADLDLDEEGILILCALASHKGHLCTATTIASVANVNRRTVSDWLPCMLKTGYVRKPKSERSGAAITDIGLDRLVQIDPQLITVAAKNVLNHTKPGREVLEKMHQHTLVNAYPRRRSRTDGTV